MLGQFCVYICVEQLGGFKLPFISLGSVLILVGFVSYFVLPSQNGKSLHNFNHRGLIHYDNYIS